MIYNSIVNTKRLLCVIVLVWVTSAAIELLPQVMTDLVTRDLFRDVLHFSCLTVVSVTMMTLALYIRFTRNQHEKRIRKRKAYFGVMGEQVIQVVLQFRTKYIGISP